MIKKYLIGLGIVILGIILFDVINARITGNVVREQEEENVVIYFPRSADFPNPEEGAVIFEFGFPAASFRVGNKTADLLMFLDSETVPGLKVGYDTKEKKIKAGLPLLSSGELDVLDDEHHRLMYTFSRKNGKQSMYLDGFLLAEGDFTGEKDKDMITSYSIYEKWSMVESPLGMDVYFGDK